MCLIRVLSDFPYMKVTCHQYSNKKSKWFFLKYFLCDNQFVSFLFSKLCRSFKKHFHCHNIEAREGDVIRNHEGEWMKGYARPLGCTNNCMAELWILRDGLILAKEMELNNLIIELDALSVVLLMNNNTANMLMESLLTNCKNLVRAIPNKQIIHVYREANQCADVLAKLGASSLSSFVVFLNPPSVVERIIAYDKTNLYCNKLVNS